MTAFGCKNKKKNSKWLKGVAFKLLLATILNLNKN